MAAKKVKFRGFVPYTLGKEVKAAVRKAQKELGEELALAMEAVDMGYKLGISYEEENSAYHASLYGQSPDSANAGLVLSARHSDLATTLCLLRVLLNDVLPGNWPDANKERDQYTW